MLERSISERINEALSKENGARYGAPAIIFTVTAYEEYKKAVAAALSEIGKEPAGKHPFYRGALPHLIVPDGMVKDFEVGEEDAMKKRHAQLTSIDSNVNQS